MSLYHATQTKGVFTHEDEHQMKSYPLFIMEEGMTYWVKNHHMKKYMDVSIASVKEQFFYFFIFSLLTRV
jgi:hypothetical protein